MEKALRDQEEELLAAERQREHRDVRVRRSYWAEDQGEWGLMNSAIDDGEDADVHWVGSRLPPEVYAAEVPEDWEIESPDGQMIQWTWHEGEYYTQDADGIWWSWADSKPWLDIDECYQIDPEAAKDLAETYANFEAKVRNFRESRQLVASRNASRGFFPLSKGKGKGKGKGKSFGGLGKGKNKGQPSVLAVDSGKGKGGQRPGSATYTGCFVCGSKDHDYRSCPKRNSSSRSGATSTSFTVTSSIYMVGNEDTGHESEVELQPDHDEPQLLCYTEIKEFEQEKGEDKDLTEWATAMATSGQMYPGFGIVDSGATETVGSLEAIEAVMQRRRAALGLETVSVFPDAARSFRFGNGEEKSASSYLHLPQLLNHQRVSLGVFSLDVPGVPILIGIKTLKKLGATVDFES